MVFWLTKENYLDEVMIISLLNFESLKDPRFFWLSLFGVGLIKPAPGTIASLLTVLLWWFFLSDLSFIYQVALLCSYVVVSILLYRSFAETVAVEDPSEVVADEFAGMWLALIFLPKEIASVAAAFLVFRLLDIGKPFFIGWIDKNLHGGLGVMADDLVAGAVTSLLLLLAVYFITS